MKQPPAYKLPRAALLMLTALLTACAQPLPISMPVKHPQIPKLPDTLSKPAPPATYSERAQTDMQAWQQTLTDSLSK